tara:strand:- start:145 stop:471 length:327 start_codon:yes stop_codon:yes gene_type:complete
MNDKPTAILSNQAQCVHCDDSIWSAHRHDYKECSCGKLMVDGGMSYIRRGGKREDRIEQSISMDVPLLNQLVEDLDEAKRTGRNSLGLVCAMVRTLRDEGYAIVEKGA